MASSPLRCVASLLFLLPLCNAQQYDDTTVAIAVVVAVALLLIALAAISIVIILVIHWWRQHKKQHVIHRSRRAGQQRREIIAMSTASSSASDSPPKPRSSTGKRVKWSLDQDRVETSVPKVTGVKPTETASGSHGAIGKELVRIPVHTVDVPASQPKNRAMEQQQPSSNEQKLDMRVVGRASAEGEALESSPPEESDNLLDHEASSNEGDSDIEPVSFI